MVPDIGQRALDGSAMRGLLEALGMWRQKEAMGINARPSKKGIRQPHASICSFSASVSTCRRCQPPARLCPGWQAASCHTGRALGAISIRYVVDGPTSPPRGQALHQPTGNDDDGCRQSDACVRGVSAMPIVPIVMSAMVNSMAGLRPTRSAKSRSAARPKARDEANAKDRYRQHHRDQRLVSRKEGLADINTAKNAVGGNQRTQRAARHCCSHDAGCTLLFAAVELFDTRWDVGATQRRLLEF